MQFELTYTEAQEAFRHEVRTWLADNVPDGITGRPRSFEESRSIYQMRRDLGRKLGVKGWLYPAGEKQYGGGGLDLDQIIVLEEETARLGLGLPPYYDSGGKMGGASIRVWGTDEQKQRFLPPIYRGEVRSWQLLTEPSAGSDLAGVKTTAIRDGDVYVVNGQKIYIGSHHGADRYWTIAVTDPKGKRHQNVSWFMIDAALPGITTQPLYMLSAQSEGETDEFGHKNIIFSTMSGCRRTVLSGARITAGRWLPLTLKWSIAGRGIFAPTRSGSRCWTTAASTTAMGNR